MSGAGDKRGSHGGVLGRPKNPPKMPELRDADAIRLYAVIQAEIETGVELKRSKEAIEERVRVKMGKAEQATQEKVHNHLLEKTAFVDGELTKHRDPLPQMRKDAELTVEQKALFTTYANAETETLLQYQKAFEYALKDIQFLLKKNEIYDAKESEMDESIISMFDEMEQERKRRRTTAVFSQDADVIPLANGAGEANQRDANDNYDAGAGAGGGVVCGPSIRIQKPQKSPSSPNPTNPSV